MTNGGARPTRRQSDVLGVDVEAVSDGLYNECAFISVLDSDHRVDIGLSPAHSAEETRSEIDLSYSDAEFVMAPEIAPRAFFIVIEVDFDGVELGAFSILVIEDELDRTWTASLGADPLLPISESMQVATDIAQTMSASTGTLANRPTPGTDLGVAVREDGIGQEGPYYWISVDIATTGLSCDEAEALIEQVVAAELGGWTGWPPPNPRAIGEYRCSWIISTGTTYDCTASNRQVHFELIYDNDYWPEPPQ